MEGRAKDYANKIFSYRSGSKLKAIGELGLAETIGVPPSVILHMSMNVSPSWAEGAEAKPGEFHTHVGSVWYCWRASRDQPGTSDAWQLAVKHGRDLR
jgi:hypothetical protein